MKYEQFIHNKIDRVLKLLLSYVNTILQNDCLFTPALIRLVPFLIAYIHGTSQVQDTDHINNLRGTRGGKVPARYSQMSAGSNHEFTLRTCTTRSWPVSFFGRLAKPSKVTEVKW